LFVYVLFCFVLFCFLLVFCFLLLFLFFFFFFFFSPPFLGGGEGAVPFHSIFVVKFVKNRPLNVSKTQLWVLTFCG